MSTTSTPPINRPKIVTWLPLMLAGSVCIGMYAGLKLQNEPLLKEKKNNDNSHVASENRIAEIMRFIDARYVDKVDRDSLSQNIIQNAFSSLDPHSTYISPEELEQATNELEGSFEGIGIEFLMLNDTLNIVMVLSGGPAERAGIHAGDQIITINDTLVAGPKAQKPGASQMLKGTKGSTVRIGLKSNRASTIRNIVLQRDEVLINSIDCAYMLDANTGYVRIARFSSATYSEFLEAIKKLNKLGMTDLVMDLRQNPGGFLEEAHLMLNELFTEKGKLLVYTEGRSSRRKDYTTNGKPNFNIRHVALIIDEGSASASEIIAGAIQDWDRGAVIGRRSFGKGLVQEEYPLESGGAVRLTIARYFTPSGRCLQRPYKNISAYQQALRRNDGTYPTDTLKFSSAAGRTFFGGGGIQPDFLVPESPLNQDPEFNSLRFLASDFAYRYFQKNDQKITSDFKIFRSKFSITPKDYSEFIAFAQKQNPRLKTLTKAQISKYRQGISLHLKAHIAKLKFNQEALFIVLNDSDSDVIKTYEVIKSKNPLRLK